VIRSNGIIICYIKYDYTRANNALLIQVCKYLLSQADHAVKRILLVGYSYGSAIACSVADDIEQVIGYTAISYPFGKSRFDLNFMKIYQPEQSFSLSA
jgi:alpha/beta superfamily hydrolase